MRQYFCVLSGISVVVMCIHIDSYVCILSILIDLDCVSTAGL